MTQAIQTQYNRYQQAGWPGALARPNEPHAFHIGVLHVPSGATRTPRPGDPVYYDATENQYAIPTTAAQLNAVCGIIVYDSGTVQAELTSPPTDANSPAYIEYKDNAEIKVGFAGTYFGIAGEAQEYDDLLVWDLTDFKWDVRAAATVAAHTDVTADTVAAINAALTSVTTRVNAAIADLRRRPFTCVARSPVAADGLTEIQIGFGRVA